jgi:hypothetical protein
MVLSAAIVLVSGSVDRGRQDNYRRNIVQLSGRKDRRRQLRQQPPEIA